MNAAVNFYGKLLRRRRGVAQEPERYANPAQAFSALREHSHLSRESLAFKLAISVPMLEKIESGAYGGSPQLDTVDRAIALATAYQLPSLAKYLGFIHTHLRMKPRRGPRPAGQNELWYMPEREGVS
jgi:transcriptional regulator with XRE-family HTH domain